MNREKKEFIYILRLKESLHQPGNWTDEDQAIINRHVSYLKKLNEAGKVILAGRTQVSLAETFGLVILRVDSEGEARKILENDPAVKEGVMAAELFPYQIAVGG